MENSLSVGVSWALVSAVELLGINGKLQASPVTKQTNSPTNSAVRFFIWLNYTLFAGFILADETIKHPSRYNSSEK